MQKKITTGKIYDEYVVECRENGTEPLDFLMIEVPNRMTMADLEAEFVEIDEFDPVSAIDDELDLDFFEDF